MMDFFFYKQKTAYEMRISDWSSDVCSSDLRRIEDAEEIRRLNGIGLPPAYVNCWFCPDPNGHLQAIGYDARGRKQYRYHSAYREAQEARKYDRCLQFGEALPRLRRQVERDLRNGRAEKKTGVRSDGPRGGKRGVRRGRSR